MTAFLNYLAVELKVAASTQNQARNAILFLYKNVLDRDLEWLDEVVQAKGPRRLPVVLTRTEVVEVLRHIEATPWLMASLMYRSGMRLLVPACRLRVKDIDFEQPEITVRDGKGQKDRVTVMPAKLKNPLSAHLEGVRKQHVRDLKMSAGSVALRHVQEKSGSRLTVAVAMGVPRHADLRSPGVRRTKAAPPARICCAASDTGGRSSRGHPQAGDLSFHETFFRDPFARGRVTTSAPSRSFSGVHDHDLHTRPSSRRESSPKPRRPAA